MLPDSAFGQRLEELVGKACRLAIELRGDMRPALKEDGSIVTEADRKVEAFLRSRLPDLHDAPIYGEEEGFADPTDAGLWLVDPIDGTTNYRYGLPFWGVTVGLYSGGSLVAGAMAMPELDFSLRGVKGGGAFYNGNALSMLPPRALQKHEMIGCDEPSALTLGIEVQRFKGRHFGCFVAEASFVATGALRGMISTRACLYDAAAAIVICREVGAEVLRLDGSSFDESAVVTPSPCEPFAILAPGVELCASER